MTAAFTFPGQGSQVVGMGKALGLAFSEARAVFDEIDDALGQKLSALMEEGPEAELTLTANAQPALMAVSMATIRVLEAHAGLDLARDGAYVAGHSLGEYTALCAAGTFTLADTARLLRLRGEAMQRATPPGEGAMAALLGLEVEAAEAIAAEAAQDEICDVANDNGGGQVVVSGAKAAVERACVIAKARGARRALMLPVSAPFHSRLMEPAARAMEDALTSVTMRPPSVPLVANILAAPIDDPNVVREALVAQVTGRVRWRECLACMADRGVTTFYEIGSGKVLSGLAKRVVEHAQAIAVGMPEDITVFKASRG